MNSLIHEFYNYEGRASRFEYSSFWIFHWLLLVTIMSIIYISRLDSLAANIILIAVAAILKLA